jgi:hypothetical protein
MLIKKCDVENYFATRQRRGNKLFRPAAQPAANTASLAAPAALNANSADAAHNSLLKTAAMGISLVHKTV